MEAAADARREHEAQSPPAACNHSTTGPVLSPRASSEASSEAFVKREPSEQSSLPRSSQHDRLSASSLEASAESSSMDLQRRGPPGAPTPGASAFIKGAPQSSQSSKRISLRAYPSISSNAAAAPDHSSSRATAAAAAAAGEAGVTPIACSAGSPWRMAAAAARRRLNVGPPLTAPPPNSLFLDAVDAMQQRAEALLSGLQGGALSLLAKTKWAALLGLGGCLLLGCLFSCLCAAAACSYYLLSAYSTPPPLHEFSVHFNFYPRVSHLLAAHEQEGGPLSESRRVPSSQSSEAPLHSLEDRGPSPAGGPAAVDGAASSAGLQVSAGGQIEGTPVLDQEPSLLRPPSLERGPPGAPSNFDAGAQAPPPSLHPPGPLGTWGPPGLQVEQWGGPQGWGPPPSMGRPGCSGEGGPFAFSLSSLEDPVAVAIVPFSNRSWELLPGDADMFAAPTVSLSSHWMQQQQQQSQQQQNQQQQQQGGEPKLPQFDVDMIMAVSVPPLSSSSSSNRMPPIMLSLLLYSGEGVLLARSSRVLPLPSPSDTSLFFRLLSLLLPPKAADISLPMLELFPVGLLAQSRFARVYLYPPLPLRRAALLLQPKTHGLRRFLIEHPYLSFLLLTLLLLAAAAVAAACCCCCCCGYLVALAAAPEEEGAPPPLLASGAPQQLQSKRQLTGAPSERLGDVKGSSSCGVSTEHQHKKEAAETVLGGPLMTGAPSLLLGGPSLRQRGVPTRHPATNKDS
ncbi:hypothetical protein Emed_006546 [Eimeria media]